MVAMFAALAPQMDQMENHPSAAEEVKEEPDDTAFRPTAAELPMLNSLTQQGIPKDDALRSLRENGHNVQEALRYALQTLCDRENSRREDMARYESEKEKEKIAAARRQEDMTLTVLGDVAPRFQEVGTMLAGRRTFGGQGYTLL